MTGLQPGLQIGLQISLARQCNRAVQRRVNSQVFARGQACFMRRGNGCALAHRVMRIAQAHEDARPQVATRGSSWRNAPRGP
ncbi:hypothetical protein B2G74_08150 [Burkholderia sp. A27]|nr:hypothetical protein B2G74_08150 [Burkholderia sp. A27]